MHTKNLFIYLIFLITVHVLASAELSGSDTDPVASGSATPKKKRFHINSYARKVFGVKGHKDFFRHVRREFEGTEASPFLQKVVATTFAKHKGSLQSNDQFISLFGHIMQFQEVGRLDDFTEAVDVVTEKVKGAKVDARLLQESQMRIINCAGVIVQYDQLENFRSFTASLLEIDTLADHAHFWPMYFETYVVEPYTLALRSGVMIDETKISEIKASLTRIEKEVRWSAMNLGGLYSVVASALNRYREAGVMMLSSTAHAVVRRDAASSSSRLGDEDGGGRESQIVEMCDVPADISADGATQTTAGDDDSL